MCNTQSMRRTVLSCEPLEDRLALDATSFVTSLYNNVLSRPPDTSGLAFYVNELKNGMSNQQVAQQFWGSPEHRGLEVDAFYKNLLHRPADTGGRAFWVNEMVTGALNEITVESDILTSPEYLNMLSHSTPALYINGLYLDVLGRLASANDLTYWGNQLQNVGTAAVVAGIVTSAESYTDILSTDYLRFLGRFPDTSGLNFFLPPLENGQTTVGSVAVSILGSPEYAAHH